MPAMTRDRKLQAFTAELERRKRPFSDFVERHNPQMLTYEHIPRLINAAERLVSGEINRLLVIEPPRYLKSEVFSRLLPAYYLRTHPGRNVALSCYVAELAWDLSDQAKNYYKLDGGGVASTSTAKKHWKTGPKNELVGVISRIKNKFITKNPLIINSFCPGGIFCWKI